MKTIGTMLCLASLLLLAACTAGPEEAAGTQDAPLPGAAVATCRVVDVQDDQLILAAADGGENDVYALALGDLPVTYEDPSQTEIVPGNQIQIGYGGTVEETFSNPKTEAGRRLVYPDGVIIDQLPAANVISIAFNGSSSYEPLIASLAMDCQVKVNILGADTRNVDGKAFGTMLLGLPENAEERERAIQYIKNQPNVTMEEVHDYHG